MHSVYLHTFLLMGIIFVIDLDDHHRIWPHLLDYCCWYKNIKQCFVMTTMMILPLLAFKVTFDQGHSLVWTMISTQLF